MMMMMMMMMMKPKKDATARVERINSKGTGERVEGKGEGEIIACYIRRGGRGKRERGTTRSSI
jgi:hypothetical protein